MYYEALRVFVISAFNLLSCIIYFSFPSVCVCIFFYVEIRQMKKNS